jgi:hypothetical protein
MITKAFIMMMTPTNRRTAVTSTHSDVHLADSTLPQNATGHLANPHSNGPFGSTPCPHLVEIFQLYVCSPFAERGVRSDVVECALDGVSQE